MSLTSGTKLGTYEIVGPLGAGGMGEVYRARDSKLRRDVAIKVLPDAFSSDGERISRLRREAEVLASLNHSRIAAIYDLAQSGSSSFLVLELVEGETLADRIARGPIPVNEALQIARQIAEALEAAHDKNVIHRDLKPANIKITADADVKVLDFGLAKVHGADVVDGDAPTMMSAPAGMILGTPSYVSPEQTKGREAQRTADVWAFGCVLYEMLSGQRTFSGETVSEILAGVLKEEPDWRRLPRETPQSIKRLLRRCLEKDPKNRLQHIGDARIEINDALTTTRTMDEPAPAGMRSKFAVAGWIVAFATLAAFFLLRIADSPGTDTNDESARRLEIPVPESVDFNSVIVISPNGQRLLYAAAGADEVRRIYVRELDSFEARPLSGTEGVLGVPFWSPDSRKIAFGDGTKLKKIDVSGGPAQSLSDVPGLVGGGFWTSEDLLVFAAASVGISQVPAAGGTPFVLTRVQQPAETFHAHPFALPDGKHFGYVRSTVGEGGGVFVGALDTKVEDQTLVRILPDQASTLYLEPRNGLPEMLLFRRDGTLLAQPFDAASLKLVGDPLPIADRIGALGRYGIFSASTNGVLVYRTVPSGANASFLMSFSNDGRLSNSTLSDTTYSQVSVSRDGKHAAVVTLADPTNPSGYDIWIVDLVRRSKTRFTSDPTVDSSPVWSPKDDAIAFSSRRAGTFDIYLQPTSGTGSPETLVKSPEPKAPTDWSRDGQFLVYSSFDAKMKWDLWVLPMTGDRTPRPFLQTEFSEYQAQFSRDGKWIAYVSEESGTPEVYVLPFQQNTTGSVRWKVSDGGGQQPRWSRDGKSLFYLSRLSGSMREAKVISETPFKTAPGTAIPLDAAFYLGGNPSSGPPPIRWDLADASTFIVVGKPTSQSQSNSIHVVVNWQSDLKRKPATTR